MYAQKYPNPTRVVSGTVTVNNDDVVLGCNTSAGAVVLNLGAIAQNYWNTNWKLYIYDASNNASVNNITINAGAGQTINNGSSVVLNTNGSGALIRIISNTKFVVEFTNPSSTGITLTTSGSSGAATLVGSVLNIPVYTSAAAYTTIQNAGTPLTQRNTLNFKGGFLVTAVDNPGTLATDVSVVNDTLYAVLYMVNPATNYIPINGILTNTPRSVLNGTAINNFSFSVGSITGFTNATGIWVVPSTAYYYISANLVIRLNETDIDSNVNSGGVSWIDPLPATQGSMAIGIIQTPSLSPTSIVALSNKQHITNEISDINITTSGMIYAAAGDSISVKVLNKTIVDVFGFAASPTIETMRIELTIIKTVT
jgi:hypothetical protein